MKLSRYDFFLPLASEIEFALYFIELKIPLVVNCIIILYTMEKF